MAYDTKEFIRRAREVHGDKWGYSLVDYKNSKTKVKIICPEHGEFEQRPWLHLRGHRCPVCSPKPSSRRVTEEEFIRRAQKIHGNKYQYNNCNFTKINSSVDIICPEHGSFIQNAYQHTKGSGCPSCVGLKKLTTKEFIKRAQEKHGNKYNYSVTNYVSNSKKVKIVCPEHGEFNQWSNDHLNGHGCQECKKNKLSNLKLKTTGEFIESAREIHGLTYDYSSSEYKGAFDKIKIICPEHGSFTQRPNDHLNGSGCPECNNEKHRLTTEEFIKRARGIHGERYNYDLVEYKDTFTKVKIICSEHGIFEQKPNYHLMGSGCKLCGFKNNSCFNPDKPAILYYIYDPQEDLYKIGITNNTIEERFGKTFCSNRAIAILEQKSFDKGIDAYLEEQEILEQYKEFRTENPSWPKHKGGRTEFFKEDILNKRENKNENKNN